MSLRFVSPTHYTVDMILNKVVTVNSIEFQILLRVVPAIVDNLLVSKSTGCVKEGPNLSSPYYEK